ncbi:Cyclic AMP receptor-like protein A-like protein [Emericellopsis cladophorae]|uniref:Cyclic AMP receptor-like protein A-like protein n=1 Tax=Emericellopsis cladophorae TaxID=2686198 RepID=A0A9P9Y811_9HYPO|nr:Cyclic AMP receptor-like protein A-like protein [Emericellopsis cladophorae]KAI6785232.1 Cyclic AMP receptor-like protein A-like protein [Emericellopsis cladophorae]
MSSAGLPDIPASEQLDDWQATTLTSLERTGGCISLVAVFLIFITYYLAPEVRNVQNRFIAFASVANVGASIASIIAMDGLNAGKESSLCQTQAFLFEMFMQSDPWWSLAMAVNVFLVFFFRAKPDSFQRWWWLYCIVCYGGPFCIALTLLVIRDDERGLVYGEATIWCWVDREWDDIRIYTYYMLIWICIVGSIGLYTAVGYLVWRTRNKVHSFSNTLLQHTSDDSVKNSPDCPPHLLSSRQFRLARQWSGSLKLPEVPCDGFYGTVITEVQIFHTAATMPNPPSEPKRAALPSLDRDRTMADTVPTQRQVPTVPSQYSTFVTATPAQPMQKSPKEKKYMGLLAKFGIADPIKRAYLRTSVLFAISVLVTWIPSSMNRIHSWRTASSPYGYHVATAAVLPLQGLWNAVIFFITSKKMLRNAWRRWRDERNGVSQHLDARLEQIASNMARRQRDEEESSDDGEMGTMSSDVELRGMTDSTKKSSDRF